MKFALQETPGEELTRKQQQFNAAMALYDSGKSYRLFGNMVAVVNVSLQFYLAYRVMSFSIGIVPQIVAFIAAFLITDFLNGLIHMYMDQKEDYASLAGPLIANFHLHHKTPRYRRNSWPVVYFNESGSEVWLVGYLFAVLLLFEMPGVSAILLYILVYVGILSSVAEVSHYLCHSSNSALALFLAGSGLLLRKRHHAQHHVQDNTHYAFLNGITDPLINRIARKYSRGYKNHTDRHYARYIGADTDR